MDYFKELTDLHKVLGMILQDMGEIGGDYKEKYWEAQWTIGLEAEARRKAEERLKEDKDYEC